MTDLAFPTSSLASASPSSRSKVSAQQRERNHRLCDAIQGALRPIKVYVGEPVTPAQRLDAIRQAVAEGGDVNAKSTRVAHDKARPLGLIVRHLDSIHAMEVLDVLLELGADPGQRDTEHDTYTHVAMRQRSIRSNVTPTSLDNLEGWLARCGHAHLNRKNRAQDTPLSVLLKEGSYQVSHEDRQRQVRALVNAGAVVDDLPPTLLSDLMVKNLRLEFDLAVELGLNVQQTTQGRPGNLWEVWAQHQFGYNARNVNMDARRAWMERLIELGVDVHAAHHPSKDGIAQESPDLPHSALMVMLVNALPDHRLDEVCLTRLKNLGCALSTSWESPVHRYAAQGKADHLATMHRLGFDLAGLRNPLGETLLHAACSADLRGAWVSRGETLSIHETVRVLLAAGCDPNVMPGPKSQKSSALVEAVINQQTFRDRFDKPATVRMLLDAGADLDLEGLSSALIGRTMYPSLYSATPTTAVEASGRQWHRLVIDEVDLAVLSLLLEHGARVPQRITPNGMPLLLGLKGCAVSGRSGATTLADALGSSPPSLWEQLVANEDPDWAVRLAHQTIEWLANGTWTTGVKQNEVVPLLGWMIEHGVPAQALGTALRASSFKPTDPVFPFIETMELRAEMRDAIPPDADLTPARRPRL